MGLTFGRALERDDRSILAWALALPVAIVKHLYVGVGDVANERRKCGEAAADYARRYFGGAGRYSLQYGLAREPFKADKALLTSKRLMRTESRIRHMALKFARSPSIGQDS